MPETCVSAVKFNVKRAAHATIVYFHLTKLSKPGLDPRKCLSMRGVGPFFAKSQSLIDNMGHLCIALSF